MKIIKQKGKRLKDEVKTKKTIFHQRYYLLNCYDKNKKTSQKSRKYCKSRINIKKKKS